jgi:hypothetical protein
MVVHACNPSTQEADAGGYEFKASMNYVMRSCLKKERKRTKERKEGRKGGRKILQKLC